MDVKDNKLSLKAIREKLAGDAGQNVWRSLDELAETPEYQLAAEDEFPHRKTIPNIDRRSFLKFMGASAVMAGLAGCRDLGQEKIVPYVKAPEDMIPGTSLYYATAFPLRGFGQGLLVESRDGRPIKVEGNPGHPSSLGATTHFAQASVLGLYDPDRGASPMHMDQMRTWEDFGAAYRAHAKGRRGDGVRLLTGTVTSPTLAAQIQAFLSMNPGAKWHQYEPFNRDNVRAGAAIAFGQAMHVWYDFSRARRIFSLDCDFLSDEPGSLAYAREFSAGRKPSETAMSRLYVLDSYPTLAGAMADHRLPVKAGDMEAVARALLATLTGSGEIELPASVSRKWLEAAADDLREAGGESLVVAGAHLPASVHAIVHAISHALGSIGATVKLSSPIEANPEMQTESLRSLVAEMQADTIHTLIILNGNPVFDAPVDLEFGKALRKVKFSAKSGMYVDETSVACTWYLPESHYLEAWGDILGHDGTACVMQPLIQPLYMTKSAIEILGYLMGKPLTGLEIVQNTWKVGQPAASFPKYWAEALHNGVIPGTAKSQEAVQMNPDVLGAVGAPARKTGGVEINFRPDPSIYDGRFANSAWLLELPKPLTTLTWENVVHVSPKMAESMGLSSEDVVEISYLGRTVEGPVWITPGHADESITVHAGYGRTSGGDIAAEPNRGFNPYMIRTKDGMGFGGGAEIKKTGKKISLASTQEHHYTEGRDIVRIGSITALAANPNFKPEHHEGDPKEKGLTLYDDSEFPQEGNQWGMSIDLNSCIGCNACVSACQVENNIPVVGKDQVSRGREMHWIRIDRYFGPREEKGSLDNPTTLFQPMTCHHCENAPCEPVCPVAATMHNHEGLNQMVYNRCVGTRYCSNNCPYKVRRFNYYNYTDNQPNFANRSLNVPQVPGGVYMSKPGGIELLRLLNNPDVTVRGRGVMEKCTYCVQRINEARIDAKKAGREMSDGEVVTACQQVCPTQAIRFGDVNNPDSQVSRAKADPRNYRVLEELNVRPRTSYLVRVTNPNPKVQA